MNYNLRHIREDLIARGFSPQEVDNAIKEALEVFMKVSDDKKAGRSSGSTLPSQLGIFTKIKLALISPRTLFESVENESLGKTLIYLFVIALVPLFISSIISALLSPLAVFALFLLPSLLLFSIPIFIVLLTFAVLTLSFIFHIGPKILKGKGTWKQTLIALVYSETPAMILNPIITIVSIFSPLFGTIFSFTLSIWSAVITIIGFSVLHKFSIVRAIAAFLLPITIMLIFVAIVVIILGLNFLAILQSIAKLFTGGGITSPNITIRVG